MGTFCKDPLWANLTSSSSFPMLSQCFRHTILIYIPFLFLISLFPFLYVQNRRIRNRFSPLPWTTLLIVRIVISFVLCLISIFVFFMNAFMIDEPFVSDIIYPLLWTLFFIIHCYIDQDRQKNGNISSGIQHLSFILITICTLPELIHQIVFQGVPVLQISIMIFWSLVFIQCIMYCFADRRCTKEQIDSRVELDSSFINRLTLWWFTSIPIKGSKRDLTMEDLFELNNGSTSEYLGTQFEKYWEPTMRDYMEKKREYLKLGNDRKEPASPSLVFCLFRMFKYEFLTASALKFISDTLQFANPFLLHLLIGFVSDAEAPFWVGLSYSILMFVSSEIRSILINAYFFIMFRMGVKIQTALTSAVYRKTLRLSSSSRRQKTIGEIINLMAIDVDFFQMVTQQIQQFWSCPYQIIFAIVYLFYTLGYSAIAGLIIMVLFVPVNIVTSIIVKNWQMRQMKLKDERTKMVNEVLNGIKVIKLYAWEVPMEEHINFIRQKELTLIKKAALVKNILDVYNTTSPFLVAASSFGLFVLSTDGNILTPQAIVSNRRLKSFFVSDELNDDTVIRHTDPNANENAIEFRDADVTWNEVGEGKPTLHNIDTNVPRGSFVAIVGRVGSGKSSLISSILGELIRIRGDIRVYGSIAYVPQQAWIQNLSVRDNITFGKAFNRRFYDQVIYACALKPDFDILPHGDRTEIGEKGINLSGGQKARISLARAVYQKDDIYLLDDPLSAVDAHVGRHIFNHVLGPRGLLASKTRVLVTHGLTYARDADNILVLEDGSIIEKGEYEELLRSNGTFAKLFEEYAKAISEEEKEEEIEEMEEILLENNEFDDEIEVSFVDQEVQDNIKDEKLIQKEGLESGKVKSSVYLEYIKATSITCFMFFSLAFTSFQILQMFRSFWLSWWSNDNDVHFSGEKMDGHTRLGIYIVFGLSESVSFLISLTTLVLAGLNASKHLHSPLIHNLMRSPISFFDTTPLGRILNRCSKDIEVIDSQLPLNFRYFVQCITQVSVTLIVIIVSTPIFVIVVIPLTIIYIFILRFFVSSSRQLKRLESVNRSPVYSHFGESIQGAASIRAYRKVGQFCQSSETKVDTFIRCKYTNIIANRWLAVRLEFIGNCVIFFAAFFAILSKEWGWGTTAGIVGVSVSYALNITEVLNFAVRQISELESNIVSVERIKEYLETPTEAEWEIENKRPPTNWPSDGFVRMENYSTRYRPELELVLRGINVEIRPGEKIGIVGRTGAGKSSFALALFRMIEPVNGMITVDGLDISQMGLHDLRKKITIIPQDPVLFSGTLRFNLDPFGEYDDTSLWKALHLAHLESFTKTLTDGLDHHISEGGDNISIGQRQLVCLARATLRNGKILVLDEATAAVDLQTDSLIQGTIRNHFKDCTVFTIAHRLNTILDYDRVMVLDKGEIAEMDTPSSLMANKDSMFSKMMADAESESRKK